MPFPAKDSLIMELPVWGRLIVCLVVLLLTFAGLCNFIYLVESAPGYTAASIPTVVSNANVQADESQQLPADEGEVAALCSLADVTCDSEPTPALESTATVTQPTIAQDVMHTVSSVCTAHGYGDTCARILYSMAWHESRFNPEAKGDYRQGKPTAYGWFQIRTMHKVAASCTSDLACAANWSLERMMRYGFSEKSYWLSVERHNGAGPMAVKYASAVIGYADNLK